MINTLNESSLHKTLKTLYSLEKDTKTEEKIGQWICDIVKKNGEIIEIQTANVSSLRVKIEDLLSAERKVTVVHPVAVCKTIETYAKDGRLLSKRKSPKKETVYSIFRQITGLYPLLLHNNFSLEIPEIAVTEFRIKTENPVQLQNKSRRFLRNWIKTDKKLSEILTTRRFKTAGDYLQLLPQFTSGETALRNDFTTKETAALIRETYSAGAAQFTSCMFWVLKKMNLIEVLYKKGNEVHYKISDLYYLNFQD